MESACPNPRTWFRWLGIRERVLLFFVLSAFLFVNGGNAWLSFRKLLSADRHPVIRIEREALRIFPTFQLLLCAADPTISILADSIVCSTVVIDGTTGETTIGYGACPGVENVRVAFYNCIILPIGGKDFHFDVGGDYVVVDVGVTLGGCNATGCFPVDSGGGVTESAIAYFHMSIASDARFSAASLGKHHDLAHLSATPVKPYALTYIALDSSRTVTLAGSSTITLSPRQIVLGELAQLSSNLAGSPTLPSTLRMRVDDLSFPASQLVYTEVAGYDELDLIAAVSSVLSLSYSIFRFIFPSSPTVPLHFRFGSHARDRKVLHSMGHSTSKVGPLVDTDLEAANATTCTDAESS